MKTRYDNVTVGPDRHGKLRARYRKSGAKAVYMRALPDQPGFEAEYKALTSKAVKPSGRCVPGSINDLAERYYKSADFMAKGSLSDRRKRRGIIERFRADFGNDMVIDFGFEHIEAILLARLEKKIDAKGRATGGEVAAVYLRKQLRRLFAYAKKLKMTPQNPVDDAERVGKNKIAGYHTWSEAEIATYQKAYPFGTKARLALEIILWTGQRRGDARLFGPKHIIRGKINFQAAKNQADLWLPIAPDLRRAIDAMPTLGINTYLVTDFGKPFSKDGLGNKMRDWCDAAGLPDCAAHGLRKAIARRMAESEATQQGMKAVGGWKGDAEVSTYVESANQERLADLTIARVVSRFSGSEGQGND